MNGKFVFSMGDSPVIEEETSDEESSNEEAMSDEEETVPNL
jgi:hypothetical protein